MKPDKLKHTLLSRLTMKESWVIFFILGLIMLDYPFLSIFNKPDFLFGIPVTIIYIIGGWAISILVIYLFTKSIKYEKNSANATENR